MQITTTTAQGQTEQILEVEGEALAKVTESCATEGATLDGAAWNFAQAALQPAVLGVADARSVGSTKFRRLAKRFAFSAPSLLVLFASAVGVTSAFALPQAGVPVAAAAVASPERISVNQFDWNFESAGLSLQQALSELGVAPREMSVAELNDVATRLTSWLRARGWMVAQVVLPQQDVTDGIVRFKVLPGVLSEVGFEGLDEERLAIAKVWTTSQLPSGQILRLEDVERVALLLGERMGMAVSVRVTPGTDVGQSRVVFVGQPKKAYEVTAGSNNYGSAATGKNQFALNAAWNDVFSVGDKFSAGLMSSNKTTQLWGYSLGYEQPAADSLWRRGVKAWEASYQLSGELAAAQVSGGAKALGVYGSYPLVRNLTTGVDLKLAVDAVALAYRDVINANPRRTTLMGGSVEGYSSQELLGLPGFTRWSLSPTLGHLRFERLEQSNSTAGRFYLLKGDVSRRLDLGGGFMVQGEFNGQLSSKNMDSYHRMVLGGVQGVRAYPNGEAMGDEGALLRLEASYMHKPVATLFAASQYTVFLDGGMTRINDTSTAPNLNTPTQRRTGWGLQWQWTQQLAENKTARARIFWAQALDGTRVSDVDGKQQRVGADLNFSF